MQSETPTTRNETPHEPSRALVPISPAPTRSAATGRASAPFLAQLIAARARLSDQRARRIAAPGDASARYGAPAPAPRQRFLCAV